KYPTTLRADVAKNLSRVEDIIGAGFGDPKNPLLVSVRSGARSSMPGMMETILNVGLNDTTRRGLIEKTQNPRFVYDAQRRLIQMYSDVVMEKAAGVGAAGGEGVRERLAEEVDADETKRRGQQERKGTARRIGRSDVK